MESKKLTVLGCVKALALSREKKRYTKNSGELMLFIIDTFAWVEYLIASRNGSKVKKLLENPKNSFVTVECCLAELRGWSLKEKQDIKKIYSVVASFSDIVPVMEEEWIEAAEERFEKRKKIKDFGLIDALLLAKQKKFDCKILTGDKHFRKLRFVEFIG